MMNPLKFVTKAEYFFNPRQAARRIQRLWSKPRAIEPVTLPWGTVVQAHVRENIGSELYWHGIFDKVVPEAIARLLDEGETAVDIGANIGQNTSLMAKRVGRKGRVIAFEPHPEIFRELRANLEQWKHSELGIIELESVALGAAEGEAILDPGPEFEHNRGSAALRQNGSARGFHVRILTLDSYLHSRDNVGVCKIDVEGHELGVLQGAVESLQRRMIRDIIFEDFNPQPSEVTKFLRNFGFELFSLAETWSRPILSTQLDGHANDSFNFLATLNPGRASERFRSRGWHCFSC